MKKELKELLVVFAYWIPFAILATTLCALVYVSQQQNLRLGANDPQIQIAKDLSQTLQSSKLPPTSVIRSNGMDITKSLSPFSMIFDNNGHLLVTSATLNGQTPVVPQGIFQFVRDNGEERFTWEPQQHVRIATVMTHYNNGMQSGYVLVGRSLEEVEKREIQLGFFVFVTWIATLSLTFVSILVMRLLLSFAKKRHK